MANDPNNTATASESGDSLKAQPKSLLGKYLAFLRSPDLVAPPEKLPKGQIVRNILRLYSITILLEIAAITLANSLVEVGDNHAIAELFAKEPVWFIVLAGVVIAPITEEIVFRLPLRPVPFNVVLPGSLIALFVLPLIGLSAPVVLVAFFMLVGLNIYVWRSRPKISQLRKIYSKYPRLIFYVLTLSFGIVHITNFDPSLLPYLPLLVMPQTIGSLWHGFIRVRYGFLWSMLGHAGHNGLFMMPVILIKLFGSAQAQAKLFEDMDPTQQLPPTGDLLLMAGIGVVFLGGGIWAAIVAWKTISEWTRHRHSHQQ